MNARKSLLALAVGCVFLGTASAESAKVIKIEAYTVPMVANGPERPASYWSDGVRIQGSDDMGNIVPGAVIGALLGLVIGGGPALIDGIGITSGAVIAGAALGGAIGANLPEFGSDNNSVWAAGNSSPSRGRAGTIYVVTYEYGGKTGKEILNYLPGSYIDVDVIGRPRRLAYDNPR